MLQNVLLLLASISAIISVLVVVVYPYRCSRLENHIASPRPDYKADKEAFSAWQQMRWALDKSRTRCALLGLAAYGVGMLCLMPTKPHAPLWLLLFISAQLLVIGLRSMIHNERVSTADDKRRYPYA